MLAGREQQRNPTVVCCALFVCWALASIAWSSDPASSAATVAKAALGCGAVLVVAIAARPLSRRKLVFAITLCAVFASVGTIITALTGGAIHHAAGCCRLTVQPELSGAAVFIAQFVPISIGGFILAKRLGMAAAMFVLAGCAVALSSSGASDLGFVASCATLAVGYRYPRVAVTFPLAIVLFGFSTALYLGELKFHSPRYLSGIFASFHVEERVRIWAYYVDLFWQRPWTGYGIDVERFLANLAADTSIPPPPNAHLHPHNEPLQILVELGAIGAALLIAALTAATLRLIRNASFRTAVAVAPAAAFATAGLVNFGIWEWWWMTGTILASICSFQLLQQHSTSRAARPCDGISAP
ncbi:MAG: O-antigen ligase family protein [Xanthobacteraceae bacterium]|nr:O-antigen ligase family protein [Xanthobacteraceae bacterium]